MRVWRISMLAALVASFLAVSATASAAPSFVLGDRADREFRGLSVLVPLTISCRADTSLSVFVQLEQVRSGGRIARAGGSAFRDYQTPDPFVICDDTPHAASIRVNTFTETAFGLSGARVTAFINYATFTEPNFTFLQLGPQRIQITRTG